MKSRIFATDIESYKEFLTKYLTSKPEYITEWVERNLLSKKKISTDKMLAFFAAEGEVLQGLIEQGKTDQATELLNLFHKFNNPILVKLELDLFTKVLSQTQSHISEHYADYGQFLIDTLSGFQTLNQTYHNDSIELKLQEASKLIGEIGGDEV